MTITDKLQLSKNITVVSGIFCVVVSLLLLLNYWQFVKNEPLKSKTIEVLVNRLKSEPNNDELKQEIRSFDLLVRKAYFNSRWQVKTGAFLLLFGAIVFAVGLRFYYSFKSKIEEPEQENENEWTGRILSQRWIIITGAAIMVFALIASFASVDHLKDYSGDNLAVQTSEVSSGEPIEIVEVGKSIDSASVIGSVETVKENITTSPQGAGVNTVQNQNEQSVKVIESNPAPTSSVSSSLTADQMRANHNGFRGPWGNGVSFHKNVPIAWDGAAGTNLLWKTAIAKHGFNSPVVWGNKVFLTGADKDVREVYCLEINSGKMLWSKKADNIPGSPTTPPKVSEDTGLAAPTVTTDGKKVFAIFANGDVICFDMDGNRQWARNMGVPDNHYGHSSSLITWGGKLFVQFDTNKGGKVLALNTNNGETIWETNRSSRISWASPVLADVAGKKQLILTADPNVAGYDLETGKELWKVECMMGEVGPSVTFGDGLVFAGNEYARMVAIDPVSATIKWEEDEYLPEVASPVTANGLLFVATSYGILVCYDAKTGVKLWEKDYGTGFYASPMVVENKVYALDTKGIMHILELNRVAKEVGSPALGEEGYTTPAFSDGRIYIRGKNYLYCFGE